MFLQGKEGGFGEKSGNCSHGMSSSRFSIFFPHKPAWQDRVLTPGTNYRADFQGAKTPPWPFKRGHPHKFQGSLCDMITQQKTD
jgi:hypothetical protein